MKGPAGAVLPPNMHTGAPAERFSTVEDCYVQAGRRILSFRFSGSENELPCAESSLFFDVLLSSCNHCLAVEALERAMALFKLSPSTIAPSL